MKGGGAAGYKFYYIPTPRGVLGRRHFNFMVDSTQERYLVAIFEGGTGKLRVGCIIIVVVVGRGVGTRRAAGI